MRNFWRNDDGNVAIIFALTVLVLIGAVGVGLDYAAAVKRKRALDYALDTALLAATNAASAADRAGRSDFNAVGAALAQKLMRANLPRDETVALKTFTSQFVKDNAKMTGTATYDADSATTFMRIFQIDNVDLQNIAVARMSVPNYIDIHFVVDNSASMGIGADFAAQTLLTMSLGTNAKGQKKVSNCALSCHYTNGTRFVIKPPQANAMGAKLRIDVAREAVIDSINAVKAKGIADRIRMSLHTFSHGLTTISDPTSDLDAVITKAGGITLDNTNVGGGTYLWKSIGQLSAKLGKGGDGTSANSRLSFVIVFTDGVENNGRMVQSGSQPVDYIFSPSNSAADWKPTSGQTHHSVGTTIQPFDFKICDSLKTTTSSNSGNHQVFTIQVKYFLGPEIKKSNTWEASVIEAITEDVDASLKQCASKPDNYVKAADSNEIKPAFKRVSDQIIAAEVVHLSQ